MKALTLNKIKRLIKRYDQFELEPENFAQMGDVLEKTEQLLKKRAKYQSEQTK